jgi:hypothetical protein
LDRYARCRPPQYLAAASGGHRFHGSADAGHPGREHHDSLELVGVQLIVPGKHELGQRPPAEITKPAYVS